MSARKSYNILIGDRALVKFRLEPSISKIIRGEPLENPFAIMVVDRYRNLCYYQANWRVIAPMCSAYSAELELISRRQKKRE